MKPSTLWLPLALTASLFLGACSDDEGKDNDDTDQPTDSTDDSGDTDGGDTDTDTPMPSADEYAFTSRDGEGSSVSYSGQTFRHLLISDLYATMGGFTARLEGTGGSAWFPEAGDAADEMLFFCEFDSETSGDIEFLYSSDPDPLQSVYDDVSSGKDLFGKIAGAPGEASTQYQDWSTEMKGWTQAGVTTPESLVRVWIGELDDAAADWADGTIAQDPSGSAVPHVYVTSEGVDLRQMIQKFLVGAIAYNQAADDYLDDDVEGKGLLADNTAVADGKKYTALEHAWDEGFGYFGASTTYGSWTSDEIANGAKDMDEDEAIDLKTEAVWGHAVNAGKRDRGAVVATTFASDGYNAFYEGRKLITDAGGSLSDAELEELRGHRDAALLAWESAIAATVVHYINDTLQDMNKMTAEDDSDYSFGDHAKHWSEMKGFGLLFQFSPHSSFTPEQFVALHDLFGQAPVLSDADESDIQDYEADLISARALIGQVMDFADENLGDENGENGW